MPNVEPRVFWSTEMTAIPKSTLEKGEIRTSVSICENSEKPEELRISSDGDDQRIFCFGQFGK